MCRGQTIKKENLLIMSLVLEHVCIFLTVLSCLAFLYLICSSQPFVLHSFSGDFLLFFSQGNKPLMGFGWCPTSRKEYFCINLFNLMFLLLALHYGLQTPNVQSVPGRNWVKATPVKNCGVKVKTAMSQCEVPPWTSAPKINFFMSSNLLSSKPPVLPTHS